MARDLTLEGLEKGIRASLVSGCPDKEAAIERYLEGELGDVSPEERAGMVERLARRFAGPAQGADYPVNRDPDATAKLLSLLLGKDIPATEMDARDAPERFAQALNTVFDTLNQLVGVINTTFFGRRPELETIRQVIGSQIGDGEGETSLKSYLEQIQQAFLIAHTAFQEASREIVDEILSELAPEACEASVPSGLRFGSLRKAEVFDAYQQKYSACKRWVDSGGCAERLLREFEKSCRKAGTMQERSNP
jgi:hypothetical protein